MITIAKDQPVNAEIVKRSAVRNVPRATEILHEVVSRSVEVWQGLIDGRVECVWGLIPPTILSERAWLWLIYTDTIEQHKFIFVRNSQRYIEDALTRYPEIVGEVDPKSSLSVRWLRWLGAEFVGTRGQNWSFSIRKR